MSDEYDSIPETRYSSFWPLLILVVGLLAWFALQDYALNTQRVIYNTQFQDKQLQGTVQQSRNIANRYVGLIKDLLETAKKDPAAAQIVKDAIGAGLIRVQPNANTNSASAPAEPAK